MKERPVQKVEAGWSAASAALRCVGLRSATAAREKLTAVVCAVETGAGGHLVNRVEKWHFTLRGK